MFRSGADCAINIQFLIGPITRPFAQAFQGNFDIACAQFNTVIQIFEFAFVPHFDRALMS